MIGRWITESSSKVDGGGFAFGACCDTIPPTGQLPVVSFLLMGSAPGSHRGLFSILVFVLRGHLQ